MGAHARLARASALVALRLPAGNPGAVSGQRERGVCKMWLAESRCRFGSCPRSHPEGDELTRLRNVTERKKKKRDKEEEKEKGRRKEKRDQNGPDDSKTNSEKHQAFNSFLFIVSFSLELLLIFIFPNFLCFPRCFLSFPHSRGGRMCAGV
jgi:hypothetical protein